MSYSNHGCQGGDIDNVYQYILANEGVDTAEGYPYRGRVSYCHCFWLNALLLLLLLLPNSNIPVPSTQDVLVQRFLAALK